MIYRTANLPDWETAAWDANNEALKIVFTSEDAKEGPTAFAEKRQPCGRAADPEAPGRESRPGVAATTPVTPGRTNHSKPLDIRSHHDQRSHRRRRPHRGRQR